MWKEPKHGNQDNINKTAQCILRTGRVATPCGREWTCPLRVIAVQCQLQTSPIIQPLACHLLPIHHNVPPHFSPQQICPYTGEDLDPYSLHGSFDPLDPPPQMDSRMSRVHFSVIP